MRIMWPLEKVRMSPVCLAVIRRAALLRPADRSLGLPSNSHPLNHFGLSKLFEFARIGVEVANALTQLLDRHGVLVVHPPKALFVQVDLPSVRSFGRFDA